MSFFSLSSKIPCCSLVKFCNNNNFRTLYSSSIGLDKLYPSSSLKLTTAKFVPEDSKQKFNGYIPVEELSISYSLSSGPGGQNVNKTSTKVDLRFQVSSAKWLHEDVRQALLNNMASKLTKDGYLVIRSDKTRSQQLNLADAMDKLRTIIRSVAEPPKVISAVTEEKLRRQRENASRVRLMEKRQKSFTKSQRQAPM